MPGLLYVYLCIAVCIEFLNLFVYCYFQFAQYLKKKKKSERSRDQRHTGKVNSVASAFFDTMFNELFFLLLEFFSHRFSEY